MLTNITRILADDCEHIGARAFANCANLIYIRIPANVAVIAEDTFDVCAEVNVDRID